MVAVPARERLNMFLVPPAMRIFFQLLSLHLDYPELSEQCEQLDNWCHEQDQRDNAK